MIRFLSKTVIRLTPQDLIKDSFEEAFRTLSMYQGFFSFNHLINNAYAYVYVYAGPFHRY